MTLGTKGYWALTGTKSKNARLDSVRLVFKVNSKYLKYF
jgi:hypothetical protein